LITQPRILILDEPTEGIQPSVVVEIEQTILSLTSRGGLSILLAEQHVEFALAAASRYYVMEAGRITSTGAGGAEDTTKSAPPWRSETHCASSRLSEVIRRRIQPLSPLGACAVRGMIGGFGWLYGMSGRGDCVPGSTSFCHRGRSFG
jgi:energy-coupling factor transporter ATP-binding protein EcfA2